MIRSLNIQEAFNLFTIFNTMVNALEKLEMGEDKIRIIRMNNYCADQINPILQDGSFDKFSEKDGSRLNNNISHVSHDLV